MRRMRVQRRGEARGWTMHRVTVRWRGGARGDGARWTGRGSAGEHMGRACAGKRLPGEELCVPEGAGALGAGASNAGM